MIKYESDMFGLRQLGIWHGSAVFRAILPAAFSSAVLVAYSYGQQQHNNNNNDSMENNNKIVEQPYTITVFIAFFSFLLAFRLNYSYQRYWEACTQIYAMQSQWVDSAVCLASFHYQCDHYTEQRPLTFGNHPALRNDTRERERQREQTLSGVEEWIDQHDETNKAQELQQQQQNELELEQNEQQIQIQTQQKQRRRGGGIFRWFVKKPPKASTTRSKERPTLLAPTNVTVPRPPVAKAFKPINRNERTTSNEKPFSKDRTNTNTKPSSKAWRTSFAHHGGSGNKTTNDLNDDNDNEDEDTRNTTKRNLLQLTGLESPTPSLFLQEAAHLYSLLSAVAMSSLRVDIEGAQSPLTEHVPGLPIPPVNPDQLSQEIKFTYYESPHKVQAFVSFCLGLSRSPGHRTMYNAARPFRVIGGVSDSECDLLLQAKGPYAQMALCNMWLKEFITREYLNGSTGPVAPPIVGRVYQFISGGVAAYNQSRKVAYVPFPFPHAQMTVFFSLTIIFIFPLLYMSFVNDLIFACVMNFTTVLCFIGIHEVAREMENPYFTYPNDLPLNNYQAYFNEALIAGMFAGFHPDAWRVEEEEEEESQQEQEVGMDNNKEEEEEDSQKEQEETPNAFHVIHEDELEDVPFEAERLHPTRRTSL